ncbi:hypothetical protein [Soonwooa sp.]|uniref:hypothetical protein n=1 Tax=Soonwooa sp. TaxID=1938592 RepID=UPI0026205E03|nr:hypothetical protein [Soonwooa sp.]
MGQGRENYLRQINRRELYFTIFLISIPVISAIVMYWTTHQDTVKIGIEHLGESRFKEREDDSLKLSLKIFAINSGIALVAWFFMRFYFNTHRRRINDMSETSFQKLDDANAKLGDLNINKYMPPIIIDGDILIVQKLFGAQRISFYDMKEIGIYKGRGRYGNTMDYVYIKTISKRYYFVVASSRESIDDLINKAREYGDHINIDTDFTWALGHYITYLRSSSN